MKIAIRTLFFLLLILAALPFAFANGSGPRVDVISLTGIIDPILAKQTQRAIATAEKDGAKALVIQLDTPGGLDSSMREMIQAMWASKVPVVVYVSPKGARAASAGLFITLAADVAAMAPGTAIGAAHPVNLQGGMDKTMEAKVTNDAAAYIRSIAEKKGRNAVWAEEAVRKSVSLTEKEALEKKVIDLVSEDLESLVKAIDGRKVTLSSGEVTLQTAEARVNIIKPGFGEEFLHQISNPNVAYILLLIGVYGIIYELANMGAILPGVVGGISLILAFVALQNLPINLAGILLIAFGIILLVAELFVVSYGILTIGGLAALALGSVMLIDTTAVYIGVSWWVVGGVLLFSALFFLLFLGMGLKAQKEKVTTGMEGMVGEDGVAESDLSPEGKVRIHGEFWDARAESGTLGQGEYVVVTSVENLILIVKKKG